MNASNSSKLALPKPRRKQKPVKRLRAKTRIRPMSAKRRKEAAVIAKVREACVERDGQCRLNDWQLVYGPCEGASQWAHLFDKKRFQTRGMKPSDRHATKWTAMLCERHHRLYDLHVLHIEPENHALGADGGLHIRHTVECVA